MTVEGDVKLGVMFDAQEGMSWELWRGHAERIEALGFESLWRSDHLFSLVGFPERTTIETWTSLAVLAEHTERLRFGPLVCPVTFRQPSLLAAAAASVDLLAEGRLEVGLGAGWNTLEHAAFGLELPPAAVRYSMLDEYVRVLKKIWSGEEASFDGEFYSLDGARGHPRPVQHPHPRIVVGGTGAMLLPIAARHADEWNAYGQSNEGHRALCERFFAACDACGRGRDAVSRSICGPVAIGASESEVSARVARLRHVFDLPSLFPQGDPPYGNQQLRDLGWFVGQPAEVAEQVEEFKSMGVSRVIFHSLDVEDRETIELLGAAVVPRFSTQTTTP